ncbi:MAG: glycogen synthase GlgA [Deltaproteobacteria bacterium HGW-Deltaproteobacteria-15]|jgi:starch synthase|nr:MAG: glycogen synthase GlgA [Deltaproteobacteria bacterium HGW-Deltaproteobacteria-15]
MLRGYMSGKFNVLFLAPEVAPFAKTGGLADVAGSLPDALRRQGVDASICLPLYRTVKEGGFRLTRMIAGLEVPLGAGKLACTIWSGETSQGTPVYFIEREDLYDRPNLYRNPAGDYYDNFERFTFFSRAVLHFAQHAGIRIDVIHCHDWQTGLVPVYLKTLFRGEPFFLNTTSVFTIHNIGYQGLFPPEKLRLSGIPYSEFHPEGLEYWGQVSLLKAGIVYSDVITTVSPRYGKEIQTAEMGLGMEGILRKRSDSLYGILNGADYSQWDPAVDPHLPVRYSAEELKGKKECKTLLISEMGMNERMADKPLLGFISRLSGQKGCDLLLRVAHRVIEDGAGLAVLGAGEEHYEKAVAKLAEDHPGRIGVRIGFDEPLAHRIMAGSDILLVPSQYEPCGLTQLYALRYGTIPVVRATGGLADTITPFDQATREGNGFRFESFEPESFFSAIRQALSLYRKVRIWRQLAVSGMKADFSWDRSAESYLEIYRGLLTWDH